MRKSPILPCLPTKATAVPDRPEWIREIKHDGYRLIVQREAKRVRLFTRNGHDWSGRFPLISEPHFAIGARRSWSTVADGENSSQAAAVDAKSKLVPAAGVACRTAPAR